MGWRGHHPRLRAEHDPVKHHEDQVMTFLMILPIFLLVAGLVGTIAVVIKKSIAVHKQKPGGATAFPAYVSPQAPCIVLIRDASSPGVTPK